MQFVLEHLGAERDVDVTAERPDVTVGDLLAAALAPGNGSAGAHASDGLGVTVDGRWHRADQTLGEVGLYEGARVRVAGPPGTSGPEPAVPPPGAGSPTGLVLVVTGGPVAGTTVALDRPLVVGRGPGCDVVTTDPTVSTHHARVEPGPSGQVTVTDLGSRNRTMVDGAVVAGTAPVPLGALVQLGATDLRVRRDSDDDRHLAVDPRGAVGGVVPFNRPPRSALPGAPAELPVPDAPPPGDGPNRPPFNVLAIVAPLAMAGAMVMLYGSLRYAMFGLLSPVMALGNWVTARRRAGRAHKGAAGAYREAVARLAADLATASTAEVARREATLPDAAEVLRRVLLPSVSLWERRRGHADFLTLRVGSGNAPWKVPLARPRGGLPDEVAELAERYATLPACPVEVGLGGGPVGIVGDRGPALALARSLVCQAAVHHGPADLGIAVLTADDRAGDWDWAKWLPHARLPDDTGRTLAAGRAVADALIDALSPEPEPGPPAPGRRPPQQPEPAGPTRLFVVDDPGLLQGRRAPLRDLLRGDAGPATGIVIAPTEDRLPHSCTTIVTVRDASGEAVVHRPAAGRVVDGVVAAGVPMAIARDCARALARFEDPELGTALSHLPRVVRLPGLLDLEEPTAAAVLERWRAAPTDPPPATAVGLADAGIATVDLVADGPHALVGGTTGSGKSELLRSLVAGMAAGVDPDHLVFVLVDYKGGSAFDACARLPHVVGLVTDLDEHLGQRALRSLEAEVRHRERLLREAGAADLPAYLAGGYPLGPLPRLVVVVDEFAAMATDLPDFLGALVGIAQRGRSLGVHLVLATQRPRGAVNADIKANTNLRIALRVQDAGDSTDIIDRPDAASIPRATPGRAYVRRGPGEVELIQTAWATAAPGDGTAAGVRVAPFRFGPAPVPPPGPGGGSDPAAPDTDLDQLVDAVAAAFESSGAAAPRRPWLPTLRPTYPLSELRDLPPARAGGVPFALADDPDHQRHVAVGWSPADGHLALFGMVGSGTTTAAAAAVVALCARESPDDCHVYGIDFGGGGIGPLGGLPHAGSILGAREREAQIRLLRRLRAELDRRRDLTPEQLPAEPLVVCVVDGVSAFLAEYPVTDGTNVTEIFGRLVADGPGARIVLVLTGERVGALPLRLASSISQRLLFRLADRNEFAGVGMRPRDLPRDFEPGRCVHGPTGLFAQVGVPDGTGTGAGTGGPGDATGGPGDLAAAVAAVAAVSAPPRRPAPAVATLPRDVAATALPAPRVDGDRVLLPAGVAEDDLQPVELVLPPGGHALVAGPPRAGVSSLLALLAHQVRAADPDAVVVAVCEDHAPLAAVADLDAVGSGADLRAELGRVLAKATRHPRRWVVLVDDAPDVPDPQGVLAAVLANRRPGLHVVAGGRIDDLRRGLNHWSRPMRSSRTGVLLDPNLAIDGDLLGLRLPRRVPVDMGAGRGFVVVGGQARLAQFARRDGVPVG